MTIVDWVGIIAVCTIVATAGTLALVIVMVVVALRVAKSVGRLSSKAEPLISLATDTVRTASGVAQTVRTRVDEITSKAEDTFDVITRKVKTTSNILQESISPPIVTLGSVLTGVSRGIEVLAQMRKRGGNGGAQREP